MHLVSLSYCRELTPERRKNATLMKRKQKGEKYIHILLKQARLTGHSTTLEYIRFQDFLDSMGLILNSILGHSTILCLKKEAVGLWVKDVLCNQLI